MIWKMEKNLSNLSVSFSTTNFCTERKIFNEEKGIKIFEDSSVDKLFIDIDK